MELILDMISLRCFIDFQVEMSNKQLVIILWFRGEIRARKIGIISDQMIFEFIKLKEMAKGKM